MPQNTGKISSGHIRMRHQLHLPDVETLRAEIERERARWEMEQNLSDESLNE